jgi:hypothetical protein
MKPYIKLLSVEERAASIRFGAMHKMAESGMLKEADGFSEWPGNILKGIAAVSLIAGIPMGALAHVVSRKINAANKMEMEAKKKIQFYTKQVEDYLVQDLKASS